MQDASIVTTGKLYEEDAYLQHFEARVVSYRDGQLVLDQSAFFPEEGGQDPDWGTISGIPVLDVQIRDGVIVHYLDPKQLFDEGATVSGAIDFAHRYRNMQMHSGEHIFSGLVHRHLGYENVGFHLSQSGMTVDFPGPIDDALLAQIEREANDVILANIPSQVVYLRNEEDRNSMEYRSKLDLQDEVRVVIYPGVDACACCAPHVRSTTEIGMIKVVGKMKWKKGVRLNLLCGRRAFDYLAEEREKLAHLASSMSTSSDEVESLVTKLREDNKALGRKVKEIGGRLLSLRAELLSKEVQDDKPILLFEEEVDQKAAREVINSLTQVRGGYVAVFIGSEETGWNYLVGSADRDCRDISGLLKEQLEARGGGKPEMVQGSLRASTQQIKDIFCFV